MSGKDYEVNYKGHNYYCTYCDRGFDKMMGPGGKAGGMDDHLRSYAHRNATSRGPESGPAKYTKMAKDQVQAAKKGEKKRKKEEEDDGFEWITQLDTGKRIKVPKKQVVSETPVSTLPAFLHSAQDDEKPKTTVEVIDWTPSDPAHSVLCDGTNVHCVGCNPALRDIFNELFEESFEWVGKQSPSSAEK